jgi:hypothetical protein
MAPGTVARPGAAQGPHGEGGGDATGVGWRETRGTMGTGAGRRTTGTGDVRLADGAFLRFGGREEDRGLDWLPGNLRC